jgi:hypothetical protein
VMAALGFGISGWLGDHDTAPAAATSDAVMPASVMPASVMPAAMLPNARTPASTTPTNDRATPYLPSIAPRLHVPARKRMSSSTRSRSRSPR